MSNAELGRLVDTFVSKIEDVVRRQALAAIQQVLQQGALKANAGHARGGAASNSGTAIAGTSKNRAPVVARPARKAVAKFVRRSSDEVNAAAEKILDYVRKHPNQRAEQIKGALGIAKNEWMLPIAKLVEARRVVASGVKRATTYSAR